MQFYVIFFLFILITLLKYNFMGLNLRKHLILGLCFVWPFFTFIFPSGLFDLTEVLIHDGLELKKNQKRFFTDCLR